MTRTVSRPGVILAAGLAAIMVSALAPAGLRAEPVPAIAWGIWAATFTLSLGLLRLAGGSLAQALRRLALLLPLVVLLALPAGLLAVPGRRIALAAALAARALSAIAAGAALAAWLGPSGIVRGARALRLPDRLAEVLAATLASLGSVTRNVRGMLRAREARRPARGAWPELIRAPGETLQGYGRLVAALLLRSLERAEALDRARRARGAGEM
jgi:energy-coupling factor transporter transmembrane protein EcfT